LGLKPRLRYLLAIAFISIAIVPLLLLDVWVEGTEMQKGVADVSEKQLLLAENFTTALDQYAHDFESSFVFFSKSLLTVILPH